MSDLSQASRLAAGVSDRPLEQAGHEAAVGGVQLPVEVEGTPGERLPDRVESAAYFVVAEALTNVAKYADACNVNDVGNTENGLERLGGPDTHARTSGVAHVAAPTDDEDGHDEGLSSSRDGGGGGHVEAWSRERGAGRGEPEGELRSGAGRSRVAITKSPGRTAPGVAKAIRSPPASECHI